MFELSDLTVTHILKKRMYEAKICHATENTVLNKSFSLRTINAFEFFNDFY